MRSLLLFVVMTVAAVAQPVSQPQVWAFLSGEQGPQPPTPASPPEAFSIHSAGSYLGVGIAEIDAERAKQLKLSEERGVLVSRVEPDSPAAKAGLQVGDALLEYNGQALEGTEQLGRLVRETPAGRKVKLTVWRAAKSITLEAVIENRKMQVNMPMLPEGTTRTFELPDVGDLTRNFPRPELAWRTGALGIECQSIADQLAEYFGVKQGVLIMSVGKGTPAEKAGLKAGDVITRIGDHAVSTPREIIAAVHGRASKEVKVTLTRERKEVSFNVTVDDDNGMWHRGPQPKSVSIQQQ